MTTTATPDLPVDGTFALLLTHDVDRPYKSLQAPYYALRERDPGHLRALRPGENPWWQFESVRSIEEDLGVRSAFYFLSERPLWSRPASAWRKPHYWVEHLGRYDPTDDDVAAMMRDLDENGWEVGLHGSYDAYREPDRLLAERERLESVLDSDVVGGRQHHLNLSIPETWRHYASAGLKYDASLGTSSRYGFRFGHREIRPFDDEFVVFPLTLMEKALPDPGEAFETARDDCERLLQEAREERAVMSVLWHPRVFATEDFPGYARLYRWLVERALEMGAWVGSPGDLYRRLSEVRDTPQSESVAVGGR